MTVLDLQTLAQLFTERLLNTAAEGVVLAGLVWILLRLVSRQNSGTRFAIWFAALLAIVALPFLGDASFTTRHVRILPPTHLPGQVVLSPYFAYCLFTVWAIVAALLVLRVGVGLWRVRQFRRSCADMDLTSLDPSIASLLADFESHRQVKVCISQGAAVPSAIGFVRPAIVFPAWLLPQLSDGEIEIILLHELAHLRRRDDWTNLAQKIVKAVFFFHPAVWWIESHLTLEREMACDDMVLTQTSSPRAYASSLISFAEKLQGARGLALAQALVSRMHEMSLRVAQILDAKRPRRTRLWRPALGLSAGLLALAVGAAPYMPLVVAFREQPIQGPTQTQVAKSTLHAAPQPAADVPLVAERAQRPRQVRVIPAAFHPRTALVPLKLKGPSRMPGLKVVNTTLEEPPMPETIFILRTARFDASGSGVWTLCIWRVGGNNPADRQLEQTIFVSLI